MRQTGRGQSSTNSHGEFRLTNLPITGEVIITAWAPGYYNSEAEIEVGDEAMIELRPIIFSDNQDYSWLAAHKREDQEDNCQNCHSDPSRPELKLPFDSWSKSAHANSAINPIFRSVYLGQDLEGNQSPLTRYGKDRDYGAFPLPPSKTLSYYGPGYKLDFPNNSGNCATCHTPMAALSSPLQTDPTEVGEIEQEGVGCDICHKIKGVILDKGTGLPHERMTGVLSYRFHRPEGEDQLFLGPKVDVVAGDDSYSPLHHQSRFCAGCHSARFWG